MSNRWRIWYADGSTFTSEDGDPADAPGAHVVVVAQTSPARDHAYTMSGQSLNTVHGYDWYIYSQGSWFATNLMGLCQYLLDPGPKVIKMGRWVPPDVFDWAMSEAAVWNG